MSAIRWPRTRNELMSSCTRAVLSIALAMSTLMSGAQWIGLVGDAQGGEDVLVEAALADEQLVHLLEELAGAGALDDAVVVGAR